MKKLLTAAVALSVLAGAGAASAQPHHQRYEREVRQADRAYRQDVREARREHRQDLRQAERRYNAGRYQRPGGYRAHAWRRGERLPASYRAANYRVDPHRYGLSAPPRGYYYTRVDNDVLLTAAATGVIAAVITNLFQ